MKRISESRFAEIMTTFIASLNAAITPPVGKDDMVDSRMITAVIESYLSTENIYVWHPRESPPQYTLNPNMPNCLDINHHD